MSTVVVGCDTNNSNDSKVQNTVCKALEKQGHKVEKLNIGPGYFANYDWRNNGKNPSGKIGVYIIADGIFSIADHYNNSNGFKYCYFIIRGDLGRARMKNRNDFETRPIGADADCTGICNKIKGKTFPEMNKICKKRCHIVFGTTADEMANELVKAMGGDTSSDSSSSSSSSGSSSSSCKEAIQKLLKHWDGEVECRIVNGTVFIHKVRSPSSANLVLQEGVNVFNGSIKVTDVNPDAPNHLTVKWSKGTITIKDEELIKRFGTIKSEVNAVKKVTKKIKSKTDKSSKKKSKSSKDDTVSVSKFDLNDTVRLSDSDSKSTNDDSSKTSVVEKEISDYDDALDFANLTWNKLKRDNGHTVECQVLGSPKWRVGEWVQVIFPSFGENGFMYITRVSHSNDDGDWTCSLSLSDYPPGWGKEEKSSSSSSDESDTGSGDDSSSNE